MRSTGGNGTTWAIIGGFGQDFINSGEDSLNFFGGAATSSFGSRANEQDMGNEGDDWIEHGNADGSP